MAAKPHQTTEPTADRLAREGYTFDPAAFPSWDVYRAVCTATATTLRREVDA